MEMKEQILERKPKSTKIVKEIYTNTVPKFSFPRIDHNLVILSFHWVIVVNEMLVAAICSQQQPLVTHCCTSSE